MASRILWRPLMGGAVWTGAGLGAGWSLLTLNTAMGAAGASSYIYSTSIVAASLWGGALLVLFPLGVSRGIIHSVQEICHVHGRPALQQALDQAPSFTTTTTSTSNPFLTTPEGNQQLLERLTLGSGWQGRLVRTLASPFLPSTTQMMVRLQERVAETAKTQGAPPSSLGDSHVVVTAVDGLMEGFLQDKKDTITAMGLLGYAGVVGLGLGVDYSYRRANQAWNPQQNSSSSSTEQVSIEDLSSSAGGIDFSSLQKRLGLQSRGTSHELEHPLSAPRFNERTTTTETTKETTIPPNQPLSLREMMETAAQLQVNKWFQIVLNGKEQADPYLQQALEVAETVTEEMAKQGLQIMEQTKQVLLDEKNQEQFQQQWNILTKSIKDLSPDDMTVKRISQEMEDALRQAKNRLNEEDVREMQRDLQDAVNQAGKRIMEEGKKAKVDEKVEQMGNTIRYKLFQWWRGAGGE